MSTQRFLGNKILAANKIQPSATGRDRQSGAAEPSRSLLMFGFFLMASSLVMAQGSADIADPEPGQNLASRGIVIEFGNIGEVSRVTSGGIRHKTEFLNNSNLTVDLDADRLWNWRGASFHIDVLSNMGGFPAEDNVGNAQGVSNIEAPDTIKIYEAWYQQSFANESTTLKFGLYDLNSEFDVMETAGLFVNPSHGIGPDFSQSGGNGPSIFPTTSVGVRLATQLSDKFYFQTVVLDGVSGDPDDPNGTQIHFDSGDGVLVALEAGMVLGEVEDASYAKVAVGSWFYSEKTATDPLDNPVNPKRNNGLYVLAEKSVYQEPGQPGQGIAVFGRYGVAENSINQFGSYFGAGIVYTGLIPGRDGDQLGLALAVANNSSDYKRAAVGADSREIAWELSYRTQLNEWLTVQPSIQYVVNPGTDPTLDNATVIGARFEVGF